MDCAAAFVTVPVAVAALHSNTSEQCAGEFRSRAAQVMAGGLLGVDLAAAGAARGSVVLMAGRGYMRSRDESGGAVRAWHRTWLVGAADSQ